MKDLLLVCVVAAACAASACAGEDTPAPAPAGGSATTVLRLAGRKPEAPGLALVSGDARLAVELAHSGMVTIDQEADPAAFSAAARAFDEAGLLAAGRVRALLAPANRWVTADGTVDLMVAPGLDAAALEAADPEQLAVVLTPYRGVAVLGSAGGGLGVDVRRAWIKRLPAEMASAELKDDNGGTWIVVRRRPLPGSDDWPLKYQGADNNMASSDTAVRNPLMIQWLGLPMFNHKTNLTTVVAGGRVFTLEPAEDTVSQLPSPSIPPRTGKLTDRLTCRQAWNGLPLWSREWEATRAPNASSLATYGDEILARARERILRFDAATGTDRGSWVVDDRPAAQVRWLSVAEGMLLAVSATAMLAQDQSPPGLAGKNNPMIGDAMVAIDLATGRERWRIAPGRPIDARTLAVCADRVFFGCAESYMAARRLSDGARLWEVDLKSPKNSPAHTWASYSHMPVVRATPELVILCWAADKPLVALAASDGSLRWSIRGTQRWVVDGNRLLMAGLTREEFESGKQTWSGQDGIAVDLATGRLLGVEPGFGIQGCAVANATPNAFWSVNNGPMWDRIKGTKVDRGGLLSKAGCNDGQPALVANGLYISPPKDDCLCGQRFRGWSAWSSAGHQSPASERLESFSETGSLTPLAVDERDWPAARGGCDQGGASRVAVGKTVREIWRRSPAHSFMGPHDEAPYSLEPVFAPCAPVAAGGFVFAGGDDGILRCFDASTGALRWTSYTGGRIFRAPTVAAGRVYVGSADGHVWCFSAADGRPLWRFRLGRREEMIQAYGHLVSRSPVVSGVLVAGGTAYAAAGLAPGRPGVVCALDAATGATRWLREGFSADCEEVDVVCPIGGLALQGGHLWVRSAANSGVRLDAATGTAVPLEQGKLKPGTVAEDGAGIGVFGGRFVVQGGRPWYWETWEYYARRCQFFSLSEFDDAGQRLHPIVTLFNTCVTPAWDARHALVVWIPYGRQVWSSTSLTRQEKLAWWKDAEPSHPGFSTGYTGLEAWDTTRSGEYLKQFRETYAARFAPRTLWQADWGATAALKNKAKKAKPPQEEELPPPRPQTLWTQPELWCNTLALAADAALVIYRTSADGTTLHRLRVADRDTGAMRCEVDLPGRPVFDGLCIDRDGRIIVALQDGTLVCYEAPQ